jgi:hypothetical protein
MKSFRVYRVFSWNKNVSELGRNNYLFSVIVSDESADYVVNPAISPEETLKFLRDRLSKIVEKMEEQETPPKDIDSWSRAATYNLGIYRKFSLVLAVDDEAEPLANFEEVRAREEGQIDRWIRYMVSPVDVEDKSTD